MKPVCRPLSCTSFQGFKPPSQKSTCAGPFYLKDILESARQDQPKKPVGTFLKWTEALGGGPAMRRLSNLWHHVFHQPHFYQKSRSYAVLLPQTTLQLKNKNLTVDQLAQKHVPFFEIQNLQKAYYEVIPPKNAQGKLLIRYHLQVNQLDFSFLPFGAYFERFYGWLKPIWHGSKADFLCICLELNAEGEVEKCHFQTANKGSYYNCNWKDLFLKAQITLGTKPELTLFQKNGKTHTKALNSQQINLCKKRLSFVQTTWNGALALSKEETEGEPPPLQFLSAKDYQQEGFDLRLDAYNCQPETPYQVSFKREV